MKQPRISKQQRLKYAFQLEEAMRIVIGGQKSWVDKSSMIILRALFPIASKLRPDLSFLTQLSGICDKAKKP